MDRLIYLDNAATTPVSENVLKAMMPVLKENFGNASSIYGIGREAKTLIESAREKVAAALGATPGEIFFTSGGTESDNWAIKGTAMAMARKGKRHIITTKIEHHAVLHSFSALERQGFETTYLPVDEYGLVTAQQVADAIREDTALVTIMFANNEIGTVLPIAEIGAVCREKGVIFHTDAVQAVGNVAIDVVAQNIDMLSLSGHKINAPKGIGAMFIRKGIVIDNFNDGGGQERKHRGGTENVASIVALGVAIEDATKNLEADTAHKLKLKQKLIDGIKKNITHCRLNGHPDKRLPGNVNISFEGIEGESMLLMLDMKGVCASSGSACTSGDLDPSHVLLAIGLPHEVAHGSLRLTIGHQNTEEDIDYVLEILPPIVSRLREMSPLWESIKKNDNA